MSLISQAIPTQGFEVVRDIIGAVLKTELEAQKILKSLPDEINLFVGRSKVFAHAEKLMINVLLDSANYSNQHAKGAHGFTNFFIDVYTSAKENATDTGGKVSTNKRDLYLGLIRFILEDHHYNTLGLPLGAIMGTTVEGFETFESSNSQDAAFVKMARLTFAVRINETQSLWEGIDINTIFTKVRLDLTEKGYFYENVQE
jgi:hypothetical protein